MHGKTRTAKKVFPCFLKAFVSDWLTVDNANAVYSIRGGFSYGKEDKAIRWGPAVEGQEAADVGNYNALLKSCPGYQFSDGE